MAGKTSKKTGWRRTFTGAAHQPVRLAQSDRCSTRVAAPPHADVLATSTTEYDTGAGGGQISNLIHRP